MLTISRPNTIPQERLSSIEYYTIEDIEDIRRIAVCFLEMHKNDVLTGRKGAYDLMLDFGTFDIETTNVPIGVYPNNTEEPIAFPYLYQFYVFGICIMVRERIDFITVMNLIADLLEETNRSMVIYIHNASFEYQFIRSMIPIDTDKVFALQNRRIAKFTAYDGRIIFRCSYLLSNMSLAKFCENYNTAEYQKDKELIDYEIIRYPWTALENEILYYSAMDVICLHAAVTSIMERENDNIKSIPMTNTGYVRRSCRNACLGERTTHRTTKANKEESTRSRNYRAMFNKQRLTMETYQLLVDAFRGGNTHANRFNAGRILENVGSVDFSSSYPAALICSNEFPMGALMECTDLLTSEDAITWYADRYWLLIQAVFTDCELRNPAQTPCPYIPVAKIKRDTTAKNSGVYDNGRLISQQGSFIYTFLGVEWQEIHKQYKGEIMVTKAYYCKKGYLPNELRNTCYEWFEKKTSLKNVAGMEYEYMKSKNRVNSVYGMTVERIIKEVITADAQGNLTSRKPTEEEAQEQLDAFYATKNRKFLAFQWGVTITAICRIRHMDLINIVSCDDFVYGDTDSVKAMHFDKYEGLIDAYNKQWKEQIKDCGCKYEAYTKDNEYQCLGIADFEGISEQFITLGAKKYALVKHGKLEITVAGVPKKAGAALLGDIRNFKTGFVFEVADNATLEQRQAWKKILTYKDDDNFDLNIDGHTLHIGTSIAMTRTTYNLGITEEYSELTGISRTEYFDMDEFE